MVQSAVEFLALFVDIFPPPPDSGPTVRQLYIVDLKL